MNNFRKPGVLIQFNSSEIAVFSFDTTLCNDVFEKIKAFIPKHEKTNVVDDFDRELIEFTIKDRQFLREQNLIKFQFVCTQNEIRVSGKQATFEKINIQKILFI